MVEHARRGVWARWFKNIAWPITHAVLPADLQRHLARLLSDYRHEFTPGLLEDHEALGERLAAYSGGASSRFRKFAENASLLGLVAGSLLLGDEDETPLLSADVLHRIVGDLSHERQASAWLRNAKRTAVQVRRKGLLGRSSGARQRPIESDKRGARLESVVSLRQSHDGWTVYVTVPSFEPIARHLRATALPGTHSPTSGGCAVSRVVGTPVEGFPVGNSPGSCALTQVVNPDSDARWLTVAGANLSGR